MNFFKEEGSDIRTIFARIKNRDFSGDSGIIIKNSIYEFSTSLVTKFGSLIFIIIFARLLMPELFGLYSLAFSTIMLFYFFSNLGINQTLVYFRSKNLEKNQRKSDLYTRYLARTKFILVILVSALLILSAKFISENYYQKPIFLALIAGTFYIFFASIISFLASIFYSENRFRGPFFKEIFFQLSRLIIVPFFVIIFMRNFYQHSIQLFIIILSLSITVFLTFLFMVWLSPEKTRYFNFLKLKINKKEKRKILKFSLGVSVITLAGTIFGYIDILIMGKFLSGEFIGYYTAAFSLVTALSVLMAFPTVLFPMFSRIKGKKIERILKKSSYFTFLASLILSLFIISFSSLIIKIIFGANYSSASSILMVLSFLVISLPLTDIYSSFLITREKYKKIIFLLFISIILNILLAYSLVTWLLQYNELYAVLGAASATVISRFFYLIGLYLFIWKKKFKS